MKADMKGLNQLEAATLLEEMNVLNGMVHYGSREEKIRAKELLKNHYEPLILQHLNQESIKIAQEELGFTDAELGIPETKSIY